MRTEVCEREGGENRGRGRRYEGGEEGRVEKEDGGMREGRRKE